jgi:hypothetical protein
MIPFTDQLIHDESNTSIEVSDKTKVTRQLGISVKEFERKRELLMSLTSEQLKKVSSEFVGVEIKSNPESVSKLELVLWTKNQAGLNVTMTRYGDKVCYLGIRGSPSRLLDGQNVVETVEESERIQKLMKKLKCGAFGARTVIGFFMIHSVVKKVTGGEEFFVEKEKRRIWKRDIGIYSVGYADYIRLKNRDKYWPYLTFVCTSHVDVNGQHIGLLESFMNIHASSWRSRIVDLDVRPPDIRKKMCDPIGPTTSLLLKKKINNVNGCYCMMYLKDYEVKETGKPSNLRALAKMSMSERQEFESELIRVDNVFQNQYLLAWVNAWRRHRNLGPVSKVTVATAECLFDDKNLLRGMVAGMRNDLGVRTLLGAPSTGRIRELAVNPPIKDSKLRETVRWMLKHWIDMETTWVRYNPTWESILEREDLEIPESRRREASKWLLMNEYLDLTLPYEFYRFLNRARMRFFQVPEDNKILDNASLGAITDPVEKASLVSKVEKKLLKQADMMTREMRLQVVPPPPRPKLQVIKALAEAA